MDAFILSTHVEKRGRGGGGEREKGSLARSQEQDRNDPLGGQGDRQKFLACEIS